MLDGIPQAAGRLLLGVAGVCVLGNTCANTVGIMAETVRRAVRQAFEKATGVESETSNPSEWVLQGLTPYRAVKNWQTLGLYAIQNVIAGTIALYVAHRFMPSSFVTSTNSFLHKFIPIQLTPDYIPLTRYIGF